MRDSSCSKARALSVWVGVEGDLPLVVDLIVARSSFQTDKIAARVGGSIGACCVVVCMGRKE